jgi:hypothetical protein
MVVTLKTAAETDSLPGRVLALVEDGNTTEAIYEFTVDEDTVTLANTIGDDDGDIPDTVEESLTAAGYTIAGPVRTDGGEENPLASVVRTLKAAKDSRPIDRDQTLKGAAGELQALSARHDINVVEAKEQLMNAFAAPKEEVPYFINRTLDVLEYDDDAFEDTAAPAQTPPQSGDCADTTTGVEEPPECVQWIDDDNGILEIEVTRPIIEWIELEIAELEHIDSVAQWARINLYADLRQDLQDDHGPHVVTDIDIPQDYAQRVGLWWKDRQLKGADRPSDLRDFLFNHMTVEGRWLLDGEPWTVAEDAGIGAHDSPSDDVRPGGDGR